MASIAATSCGDAQAQDGFYVRDSQSVEAILPATEVLAHFQAEQGATEAEKRLATRAWAEAWLADNLSSGSLAANEVHLDFNVSNGHGTLIEIHNGGFFG